jgi:hypothetical protein
MVGLNIWGSSIFNVHYDILMVHRILGGSYIFGKFVHPFIKELLKSVGRYKVLQFTSGTELGDKCLMGLTIFSGHMVLSFNLGDVLGVHINHR